MNESIPEWVMRLMPPIIVYILKERKEGWNAAFRIWRERKECLNASFRAMILLVIVMGVSWYFGASTITLLGAAVIAYFIMNLVLVSANYQKKQFEQIKNREVAIYKGIIAQWEEKLFQETQTISQEWLKQWDNGVKQWERDVLGIKNLECISEANVKQYSMIKNICEQGYKDIFILYEQALNEELTSEHHKKIEDKVNHLMDIEPFKKNFMKTVKLMKENRIVDEEFEGPLQIDSLTKEKKYKHAMLFFHCYLYVVDNIITDLDTQQKEEKSKSMCEKQESMGSYQDNIFANTEYEEIAKRVNRSLSEYELLLSNKKDILSFLQDISDSYKVARDTFVYYQMLINAVKHGYIAFDKDCCHSKVKSEIDACKEQDKNRKEGLNVAQWIPTFEEAYKLGVKKWMKVSNGKFDNQWIFWEKLIQIENAKKKLQIILGDETLNTMAETIGTGKKGFDIKLREAIFENKDFRYNQSCENFIGYFEKW